MRVIMITGCASALSLLSALNACADLSGNVLEIGRELEKGAPPIVFILKAYDERAMLSVSVLFSVIGTWPVSQRNFFLEKAAGKKDFVGVLPRCRDPCYKRLLANSCAVAFFLPKEAFVCSIE